MTTRLLTGSLLFALAAAAYATNYSVAVDDLAPAPDLNRPFGWDWDSSPPDYAVGAPISFGGSSFYASVDQTGATPADRYRALRVNFQTLFHQPVAVGDVAGFSYQTYKNAGDTAVDWRTSMYTAPQGDGNDSSIWYRSRLQSRPADALNKNAPALTWNAWTTPDAAANQLQFYDNSSKRTAFSAADLDWSELIGGPVTRGAITHDFSGETIMWLDIILGANSGGGTMASQLDALIITLTNGESAIVNLEQPVYVATTGSDTTGTGTEANPYQTINKGITMAPVNGIVRVAAGSYAEYVAANKSVTLQGVNRGIHPAVGTHPFATVGTRGSETILTSSLTPSADGVTLDGLKFTKNGGRVVDTYANANGFQMLNCIFDNNARAVTQGVIQFGGGSHTDMVIEFNLFQDDGDHTLYTGGGPFDRLEIRWNKFNVYGNGVFWTATSLVDGVVQGNEFDGTIDGVPGDGGVGLNIGQGGNIQILDNWFHDMFYTPFQVGIVNGAVQGNLIERTYAWSGYWASAMELWGGQYGTAVSQDVLIECNVIRYNDIAGAADPSHGVRLRAPETGSGIDGSTIHIQNNTFANGGARADAFAIRHQGDQSKPVDAEDNWWGTTDLAAIGLLMQGSVEFDPPATKPPVCSAGDVLYLEPTAVSFFVKPTETCVVDLKVANLQQPVVGLQAMLNFSSTYFNAGPGEVGVAAGGGVWDQLIYNVWQTDGDLDVAVGVNQTVVGGTQLDATTATVTLTPTGTEGVTTVVFRPDGELDTEQTLLTDVDANAIYPVKVNSANIYIDGTAPIIGTITATQDQPWGGGSGADVKDCAHTAYQGTVHITVEASDALSGLDGQPTVELTSPSLTTVNAAYVDEDPDGTFNYTWDIDSTTENGTWQVTVKVKDRAGNQVESFFDICVNRNQVAGQVELEGFVGSSRIVTFVATGGTTKTWNLTLTGWTGGKTSYTLTDVPAGTTAISAKTAWTLREKLAVTPDSGSAVADFLSDGTAGWSDASDHYLRGGDLNGSNSINIQDYAILKLNWLTTNPVADITGNGTVNAIDYELMKRNWFKLGDAQ